MLIYPPEIKRMKEKIKPWKIGAGIFKPDTPPEILELNKRVSDWLDTVIDDEL